MTSEEDLRFEARLCFVAFIFTITTAIVKGTSLVRVVWLSSLAIILFWAAIYCERQAKALWWNRWYRENADVINRQKKWNQFNEHH